MRRFSGGVWAPFVARTGAGAVKARPRHNVLPVAFQPDSLAGLELWFSADQGLFADTAGTTPVANDGDAVALWQDRSGNGRHYSQATAGSRPTYHTGQLTGQPVVRFSTDYLEGTPFSFTEALVLIVAKDSNSAGRYLTFHGTGNADYQGTDNAAFSPRELLKDATALQATAPSSLRWRIQLFQFSGGTGKIARNGQTAIATDTYANTEPINPTATYLGAGYNNGVSAFYPGDMAEVLMYSTVPSAGQIDQLLQYLADKYGAELYAHTAFATNAADHLTIPTYDGSGEATHPDVYDAEVEGGAGATWNGYRYWMAMTPYQGATDALENPSILASNDGDTWVVPAGLTNPIDPAPTPNYNSDTDLVVDQDGLMWCFYREAFVDLDGDEFHYRTSSDGVTWSAEQTLDLGVIYEVSPTIAWDGTQWVMYSMQDFILYRRTAPALAGPWSARVACTLEADWQPWHLDVVFSNGRWYMMLHGDGKTSLYFAASEDGLTWYVNGRVTNTGMLKPGTTGQWDDFWLYRSTMQRIDDTTWDLWYSGVRNTDPQQWHIGRTTVTTGVEPSA